MNRNRIALLSALTLAVGAALVFSCAAGTTELAQADASVAQTILWEIRIPRAFAALFCGAALGAAGAAMQGLFRNPLADPGLIGVSAGGSLGALLVFAFANGLLASVPAFVHAYALPLAAMAGALAVTWLVLTLAGTLGRSRIGGMLLVGIAVNSAIAAITGLILHFSADHQIRAYLFWTLGGLDRAEWRFVVPVAIFTLAGTLLLPRFARALDVLALGEAEAHFAGVNVKSLRRSIVWISAGMVGAAVALGGMIGFVGLVAPHLVRLVFGPAHRFLLPVSALTGGLLLIAADIAARTFGGNEELPLGVVTAVIGAPVFLGILLKRERSEA